MRFKLHDGGRSRSSRPKQRRDCVVRAIAIAACLPYDLVYEQLENLSPAPKTVFNAMKGQPRMSLAAFAEAHPTGRYVAQCAGHLVAVVNGFVYDDSAPRASACVYAAFNFTQQ